ncbi:unnamed protein product [Dimorphilus gyrociliatus]|uniref:Methyltransferase FkbM domain-containing protein n=1 Tax=Dimorphilus gyrociliatus TaxID=2664684 RepID=A0A7I8VDY1_9ANNE|nr:unnamed protein product [Dimorphilus gyrociliatus]
MKANYKIVFMLFTCIFLLIFFIADQRTTLKQRNRQNLKWSSDIIYDLENGRSTKGLVDYIRERYLQAPPTKRIGLHHTKIINIIRNQQSTFVDLLLKGKKNGIFIECGAADGLVSSKTIFFERERHWTGILMEVDPFLFKLLNKRNRNAYLINAAISLSNKSGPVIYEPRSTFAGMSLKDSRKQKRDIIEVQSFPFNKIVQATPFQRVNFLSIEQEQANVKALRSIDYTLVPIDVILVEYNYNRQTERKLDDIKKLLLDTHLYKFIGTLNKKEAIFARKDIIYKIPSGFRGFSA